MKEYRTMLYDEILSNIHEPSRIMAPMRWYGGKGQMTAKLLPLLPDGKVYVEPYCGAASLFFHKTPHPVEVLNDINEDIVNLFRVLQDEDTFKQLFHRVLFTPYSRAELKRALEYEGDDPVMRAWSFYIRTNQGVGGAVAKTAGDWGRVFTSVRNMACVTNSLRGRMKMLALWHDRLTRVQLDCRDALEVIEYWDSNNTVFYIDPLYVLETRHGEKYKHEASIQHHESLIELLLHLRGNAMVSGYDHELYHALDGAGWARIEFKTACNAAGRVRGSGLRGEGAAIKRVARTEIVWIKGEKQMRLW